MTVHALIFRRALRAPGLQHASDSTLCESFGSSSPVVLPIRIRFPKSRSGAPGKLMDSDFDFSILKFKEHE